MLPFSCTVYTLVPVTVLNTVVVTHTINETFRPHKALHCQYFSCHTFYLYGKIVNIQKQNWLVSQCLLRHFTVMNAAS